MNEAQWLACADPRVMAAFLRGWLSPRRHRLCACGCARLAWDRLTDVRSRQAVEVAEQFADGRAMPGRLRRTHQDAAAVCAPLLRSSNEESWRVADLAGVAQVVCVKGEGLPWAVGAVVGCLNRATADAAVWAALARDLCGVMRDVVAEPFGQTPTFNSAWRTAGAVGLARCAYDTRAFHDLPILADALEDAGCDDAAILRHCRGDGPHVRGCWVVDTVLGLA